MTDRGWRVRSSVTETQYRQTEGAALALARSIANWQRVPVGVHERGEGDRWAHRYTIRPSGADT